VELVSAPLTELPVEPAVAREESTADPEGVATLLVLVSGESAPSPVTVTSAAEDVPGFARVSALRLDESEGWTWVESTVARECDGAEQSLVPGESEPRHEGEESNEPVWGDEPVEEGGRSDAPADGGALPCGAEGDAADTQQV
jgi:hypothetical protein